MPAHRYHPGTGSPTDIPLSRFFPPISQGAVSSWLAENVPAGSLIIDPYGTSPQMLIEVAGAGYQVISVLKNPITRFIVEVLASSPQRSEMQSAIAELASTKRGDTRLEPYLLSIYETRCQGCDSTISADAFLWEQNTNAPYAKRYSCPYCGQQGEFPTNEDDIHLASEFTASGQNYYQALDRVAKPGSLIRTKVETILDHFSNRAIHAVFTLINRVESMDIPERRTQLLEALTLTVLDRANKLWPVKELDKRPLRVYTPVQYLEVNIWKALEESIDIWCTNDNPIEVVYWPQIPDSGGGISIYSGKFSSLIDSEISKDLAAAVTVFPRLNPAYWSFSALWAGWLWSKKTSQTFVNILNIQRFDWAWHSSALTDTNNLLAKVLPMKTKYFGVIADTNSQFNNAVVLAGNLSGFDLLSSSPRPEANQIQLIWNRDEKDAPRSGSDTPVHIINKSVKEYLYLTEEPSPYINLQFAALEGLARQFQMEQLGNTYQERYQKLETNLKIGLSSQNGILRFGGSDRNPEEGKHWLDEHHSSVTPLSDQIEQAVFNELINSEEIALEELEINICSQFPGTLTPSRVYIEEILRSYANKNDAGRWSIRDEDLPKNRDADIIMIHELLGSIGKKLGYQMREEETLSWWSGIDEKYRFYILPNASISPILTLPPTGRCSKLIVLPGSRTELVMSKLQMDPRLPRELPNGWRFLKFRQVRFMSLAQSIIPENIDQFFNEDPLEETDAQLSLL
jgi:hypothetical protein